MHRTSQRASVGAVAAALVGAFALPCAAHDKPLWELGIGAAALQLPHYRGSDQSHLWLLPVPYVVYRGSILKADREGARAILLRGDHFNVNVSVNASLPKRSKDNDARRGMPNLKSTVEFGPRIDIELARASDWKLDLRWPLRAVATVERSPRAIGWTSTPSINLDLLQWPAWKVGLQGGPVFGSRRYHAYFYEVEPADALPGRAAYRAPGGYGGMQYTATLSRSFGSDSRWWLGTFARYDSLRGARFDASPLLRERSNVSFGIALVRVLAASARPARDPD